MSAAWFSTYCMRSFAILAIMAMTFASANADCIEPPFTHIWLSPFATDPSFADTPLVNSTGSVSLYLWARLPEDESISALSLSVSSSNDVEFESASLDNPRLVSRDGKDATRFEYTPDPIISPRLILF